MIYCILDGARLNERIEEARLLNSENFCLQEKVGLSSVSPFIFSVKIGSQFESWIKKNVWGDSAGIFFVSGLSLNQLGNHFKNFIQVREEDIRTLYFRFYDPRVLRVFLPTCDSKQLKEFLGPIQYLLVEDENPSFAFRFLLEEGHLKSSRISASELFDIDRTNLIEDISVKRRHGGWSHLT